MTIQEFEKQLKKKDNTLSVIPHPSNEDMAGVYWGNVFVCGIPSNEIFEEIKPEYRNKIGERHRTAEEAIAKVNNFLHRIKNEEGFLELMTEKI